MPASAPVLPSVAASDTEHLQYSPQSHTTGTVTFDNDREADDDLRNKQSSGALKSWRVLGDPPAAVRLALLYVLYANARKESWGTEMRLQVPIVKSPGADPVVTPVVVSYAQDGAGTVSAVGLSGPGGASDPESKEQLAAELAQKLRVRVVDLAKWSAVQLRQFLRAADAVRERDPKALSALHDTVLRMSTDKAETSKWTEIAHFGWENVIGVSPGAGEFVLQPAAFESDPRSFVGSAGSERLNCRSALIVAHEMGHAVENQLLRKETLAVGTAIKTKNAAIEPLTAARNAYVVAVLPPTALAQRRAALEQEYRDKVQQYNAQIPLYEAGRAGPPDQQMYLAPKAAHDRADTYVKTAYEACNAVILATEPAIRAVQDDTLTDRQVDAMAAAAVAAAQQMAAAVGTTHKDGAAEDARALVTALANSGPMISALRQMVQVIAGLVAARKGLDSVSVAVGPVARRSKRVADFEAHVRKIPEKDQARVIGITAYAREKWPDKPGELYAEAYALWVMDKPFLLRAAPELERYFRTGQHLS